MSLNKPPLLSFLSYTLNKQSQRIAAHVCDYSQWAGAPDSDLQMCDDDGVNVWVTSTFSSNVHIDFVLGSREELCDLTAPQLTTILPLAGRWRLAAISALQV